jgi:hypothetical protein
MEPREQRHRSQILNHNGDLELLLRTSAPFLRGESCDCIRGASTLQVRILIG